MINEAFLKTQATRKAALEKQLEGLRRYERTDESKGLCTLDRIDILTQIRFTEALIDSINSILKRHK